MREEPVITPPYSGYIDFPSEVEALQIQGDDLYALAHGGVLTVSQLRRLGHDGD